jgi:carbon-monoxide dehydrogenase large subunit
LADGAFRVKGSPDKSMTMAEISGAAHIPPQELPSDIEPGLEETSFYDPENFVFPFGAHACIVDVDVETGKVQVVDYYSVDDCGPAINPMLIEGQVHGGIAHAIGQALYEQVVYDEEGQLVTGTFVDYALPTAAELPSFNTDRTETPSPVNSLGVKGVGEAGTIAATPAVTAAVLDAVRPVKDLDWIDMPLTPLRVWQALHGDGQKPTEQGQAVPEHGQQTGGSGPTSPGEARSPGDGRASTEPGSTEGGAL